MTAEVAHGLVDDEGRLAEAEDALLGLVPFVGLSAAVVAEAIGPA